MGYYYRDIGAYPIWGLESIWWFFSLICWTLFRYIGLPPLFYCIGVWRGKKHGYRAFNLELLRRDYNKHFSFWIDGWTRIVIKADWIYAVIYDQIKRMRVVLIHKTWWQPFNRMPLVSIIFMSDTLNRWWIYRFWRLDQEVEDSFPHSSYYCPQRYAAKTYVDHRMILDSSVYHLVSQ